ncbi:MAG: hypothetical protein GQE15_18945 [Archangiaceae bacterium]|nr:hypothetical protein [Archangiaceae bacterium]
MRVLLLLPSLLCGFIFFGADRVLRPIPPLRWTGWLLLSPFLLGALPALVLMRDEPEGRYQPVPSFNVTFERGPWAVSGVLGLKLKLPSGGQLEFFRPAERADVDPMMVRCLEKGFGIAQGLRWGGLRLHLFAAEQMTVLYAVECDGRVLGAKFTGTLEEETLADTLFASVQRTGEMAPAPAVNVFVRPPESRAELN